MSKPPESHYNLNKLHVIFAISALILLGGVGGLFMDDYSREWKKYQKLFRGYEVERSRIKLDKELKALEADADYKALQDEMKSAKEASMAACAQSDGLKTELLQYQTESDLYTQDLKFTNAELDAAKYRFESIRSHHLDGDVALAEQVYQDLQAKQQQLQLSAEQSADKIEAAQSKIEECSSAVKELERRERLLTAKAQVLQRKLDKIDPAEMSMINQIANMVRDMPILDLSNPNFKIEQVHLKGITDDVIITQVPKVDRCMTCHLGIANPDYKDFQQPFTTHPNLELFVNNDSAHPLEEFGCTVCHGGRGRGTSFNATAHTPSSPEQAKEWEEKYGWKEMHHWDKPMFPSQYVEAGCFKCHSGETVVKGAEKLNLGMNLIERAGCYNCHEIKKYKGWPKSGPNLQTLASKMDKDWAYKWIESPQSFREDAWMPSYFHLSNNEDPDSKNRSAQEIHAIVEYLFAKSTPYEQQPMKLRGNKERGEELVAAIGCMACHQTEPVGNDTPTTRDRLRQQHGPTLSGLGSKTSKQWLYNWIKDPQSYHAQTRMPNMRLSDQEAADVVEYLISSQATEFDQRAIPSVNEAIVDDITMDFLKKLNTTDQAKKELAGMSLEEKLKFSGEKLVSHYGCYSCHDIAGFGPGDKPIGVELTEEGEKSVHKLDFGFVHIDHTKQAWFKQKVLDPRAFDHGKIKQPLDKLIMPNFNLSDQEAEAVVTALLGFVTDRTVKNKKMPRTAQNLYIEEGQKLIRQLNCNACHIMENDGGTIQQTVRDWLVKYDERSEADAASMVTSFSPPNLIGEGRKVQAQWLFEFLHNPTPIRPWLKVRMPTYTFNAAHLNTFLKYFTSLDNEEFPFVDQVNTSLSSEEFAAAEQLFSKDYFGCALCHIVGDQLPSGSPDSWAPNFALSKTRLKPEWIVEWIKNPQALLPGTKMPGYYDPANYDISGPEDILKGNEDEQIRVLRNYLFTITESQTPSQEKKTATKE